MQAVILPSAGASLAVGRAFSLSGACLGSMGTLGTAFAEQVTINEGVAALRGGLRMAMRCTVGGKWSTSAIEEADVGTADGAPVTRMACSCFISDAGLAGPGSRQTT